MSGFKGYNYDVTLDHFVARYYDARIGKFISADSIVPDPANPQSLNRYSYVLNNPLRYTDPSGNRWCESEYCIGWTGGYIEPAEPVDTASRV